MVGVCDHDAAHLWIFVTDSASDALPGSPWHPLGGLLTWKAPAHFLSHGHLRRRHYADDGHLNDEPTLAADVPVVRTGYLVMSTQPETTRSGYRRARLRGND